MARLAGLEKLFGNSLLRFSLREAPLSSTRAAVPSCPRWPNNLPSTSAFTDTVPIACDPPPWLKHSVACLIYNFHSLPYSTIVSRHYHLHSSSSSSLSLIHPSSYSSAIAAKPSQRASRSSTDVIRDATLPMARSLSDIWLEVWSAVLTATF